MRLFLASTFVLILTGAIFFAMLHLPAGKIYQASSTKEVIFRINKNETLQSISHRLKQKKLIISESLFQYGARLKKIDKLIKYGEFSLTDKMSIFEILKKTSSNDHVRYNIFVKECITSWEIIKLFKEKHFLEDNLSDEILAEGGFAPDTYKVGYNTKFSELLDLMRLKQDQILQEQWNRRQNDLPIYNKYDLLILASIIEKEAANALEMPKIASVFFNRLEMGMRLQSDPTVTYGQDLGNVSKRKELTKNDLKISSPYNTYRIPGLPISPICNPSKSAIIAAANPINTNFIYFVMSDSGEHIFSENFSDHKKNVSNWRKSRK